MHHAIQLEPVKQPRTRWLRNHKPLLIPLNYLASMLLLGLFLGGCAENKAHSRD